jgi:DNA-binding transcriptional ArsR family regulator
VSETADVATLGRLLAAPARAAMLDALFDGRAWSVSALAEAASIAPSTASEHLHELARGGLVSSIRDGRYRRYRIASDEIAAALESLSTLAPLRASTGLRAITRTEAMRAARTCYDHLAGGLGVAVADGLVRAGVVLPAEQSFAPTPRGEQMLRGVDIDVSALTRAKRPTSLACLDWSERRPHLAGGLGAALLGRLETGGGIERIAPGRAVRLRPAGHELLGRLGVSLGAA